ncbi:MAG TPA: NYN domain-containing protein, partial [Candidatus Limnocylindrales bacterium]
MSKNVAVFVDVANIFYAAKAAGVDIDYVTLLKAATAGRDFVRAYAYTGLDPENENQRQFHAFLGRNNYKVISKDIRKYGDGRIKANLDIELVVDMMKTARNLDIAVVVSGDGDFAPAIRAVQEMGVRCEVISFRGNTSSDLIEVADLFTDIAQIARVDKSGRSGRRVAAEGDLSMTEVPEKETEGIPRRRRGRATRDERPQVVEVEEKAANLVAMPGERLSRAGEGDGEIGEIGDIVEIVEIGEEAPLAADGANDGEVIGEDGRRRRRRRGGRGRGRGHRPEEEGSVAASEPSDFIEEEEEFEEPPAAQAPVHTFGSVWDSQLGVPSAGMPPSVDLGGGEPTEDDDYDEPEIPEYLLAERRQQGGGQRPGGRGRPVGRGRGAYQQALDRERYGRGAAQPTFTGGGGGNRPPDRNRDRGRQGRPPQGGRPVDRGPRVQDRQMIEPRSTSSEPWSEVPPELEEMLRAELARKQPVQPYAEVSVVEAAAPTTGLQAAPEAAAAKPTRTTRPRTTKAASTTAVEATQPIEAAPPIETPSAAATTPKAKPKAAPRTRTATATKAKAPAKVAPA